MSAVPVADPKLASVQLKLAETHQLMHQNIQMSLDQTTKLHNLEINSEELERNSHQFKISAVRVRRRMCGRSWKMMGCIMIMIVVLILVIVVPIVVQLHK